MKYMNCYCECYINFHVHDCTEMSTKFSTVKIRSPVINSTVLSRGKPPDYIKA